MISVSPLRHNRMCIKCLSVILCEFMCQKINRQIRAEDTRLLMKVFSRIGWELAYATEKHSAMYLQPITTISCLRISDIALMSHNGGGVNRAVFTNSLQLSVSPKCLSWQHRKNPYPGSASSWDWLLSFCEGVHCRRPCYNNGTCTQSGQCQCAPGYYGRRCQIGIKYSASYSISFIGA